MLAHFEAHVFCQLDDRVTRDTRQGRRGERWSKQHAVFHFKQVLACAFRDIAVNVQRDTFLIAVAACFAAHQQ
ncbi:hypothetical protein D3C77_642470 [compost metagenome]